MPNNGINSIDPFPQNPGNPPNNIIPPGNMPNNGINSIDPFPQNPENPPNNLPPDNMPNNR